MASRTVANAEETGPSPRWASSAMTKSKAEPVPAQMLTAIKARRRSFMTATPRYFTGRTVRETKEADS
jgi:hypothetical protein